MFWTPQWGVEKVAKSSVLDVPGLPGRRPGRAKSEPGRARGRFSSRGGPRARRRGAEAFLHYSLTFLYDSGAPRGRPGSEKHENSSFYQQSWKTGKREKAKNT